MMIFRKIKTVISIKKLGSEQEKRTKNDEEMRILRCMDCRKQKVNTKYVRDNLKSK